ncbi:MAG: hypothetical protein KKE20_06415 [Nanoarchaeota archaeon]|nr:hypothetical protein [Nanoarchaeota archaeon]
MKGCNECQEEIEDTVYLLHAMYTAGRKVFEADRVYLICSQDAGVIPDNLLSRTQPRGQSFALKKAIVPDQGFPESEGEQRFVSADTVMAYLPYTYKQVEAYTRDPANYHPAGKMGVIKFLSSFVRGGNNGRQ